MHALRLQRAHGAAAMLRLWLQVTMSSLVNALELGGQWEAAVAKFHELRERGVQPNAICFNAAISALAKGFQVRLLPPFDLVIVLRVTSAPAASVVPLGSVLC